MTEEQIKKARHNYASRVYHEQMRSASEGEVYGFEVGYRAAYSEIEAHLSSKEQECEELNTAADYNHKLINELTDSKYEAQGQIESLDHQLSSLRAENSQAHHKGYQDAMNKLEPEFERLRAENGGWKKLYDLKKETSERNGKIIHMVIQKLLEVQVANTSIDLLNSELSELRKRCEDLEAERNKAWNALKFKCQVSTNTQWLDSEVDRYIEVNGDR